MKPPPTLHSELAAAIREVLERATQPLNLAKIRAQLNPPFKVPPKLKDALAALLETEAGHGRIHRWPALRYWNRDGRTWAVEALIEATSRESLSAAQAIRAIAKQYGKQPAEALIAELLDTGELIRIPLFGAANKAKLSSRIHDEAAFRAELDAARRIIDAGYRRLSNTFEPSLILDTLATLEPRKGLLVTAPRLYRALPPNVRKSEIDAALLRLQEERRVILHRHSNPASLSDDERQSLIEDGAGNYYVGACWRVEQD